MGHTRSHRLWEDLGARVSILRKKRDTMSDRGVGSLRVAKMGPGSRRRGVPRGPRGAPICPLAISFRRLSGIVPNPSHRTVRRFAELRAAGYAHGTPASDEGSLRCSLRNPDLVTGASEEGRHSNLGVQVHDSSAGAFPSIFCILQLFHSGHILLLLS